MPGLLVHESTRFGQEDITIVDGIPVSIPERNILELAGLKPSPDFVEAVMHALRRKRLITYESTRDVFERLARPGVRGVKAMRVALERWNPDNRATASEMETRLVHVLRSAGLPEPILQYTVYDDNGMFVADVDAGLPQWRITIEYDSKQEHSDEFQIAKDARRRDEILAAGFFPLTARHRDLLRGGDELVDRILRIARRTGVTELPKR
jgi:very-short-patch-repair endonuclease